MTQLWLFSLVPSCIFYMKLEVEGLRRGRGKRMKPGCIPNIVLYSLCSCKCPSSQNFGGTGHDLFIDNNCYRTSKGHTAKSETWREHFEGLSSQMQNGKDGTQQLLGSSSQPRQECPIVASAVDGQSPLQVGFIWLSTTVWQTPIFTRPLNTMSSRK